MSGLLLDFIISKTKEYLTIFSYTLESAMWPCQLSESGEIKVKLWSIPRLHQLFWMINVNILNVFWTCAESKPTHRCKLSQHAFRIQSNKNCFICQIILVFFSRAWCYFSFHTVSSSLHLLQCWLAKGFMGQLQLVPKSAQITLCFGFDNAQLRVNVLVLIRCIFLVLKSQYFAY